MLGWATAFLAEATSFAHVIHSKDRAKEQPAPISVLAKERPIPGDPLIGQRLFNGTIPFQKGGASCMGCHNAGGLGALGGGTLGPDMTRIYKEHGEDEIIAMLSTPSSYPTMKFLYESRPLTPQEQSHLRAFFQAVAEQEPARATIRFSLLALGCVLIFLFSAQLMWRKRLQKVRKPLVEEALKKEAG